MYAKFPKKNNISYPVRRLRIFAYQGVRNISFSKNLACKLNK